METSFVAEPLFHIGSFPFTNALADTFLVDVVLLALMYVISKNITSIPGMLQNLVEMIIETFYSLTESVAGERSAKIFPYFMGFFLFILLVNWSGLIPGVGTIGIYEEHEHGKTLVPLIRSATSDINMTLALALVSAVATHIMAVRSTGIKDYLSRYFSINPINLFIGILEIISEITKVVSLSFRLFGNVFAGEVVLLTVSTIFAFLFPLPFMMLEIIVGLVQALVFSMLTMAFMAILSTPHHAEKH